MTADRVQVAAARLAVEADRRLEQEPDPYLLKLARAEPGGAAAAPPDVLRELAELKERVRALEDALAHQQARSSDIPSQRTQSSGSGLATELHARGTAAGDSAIGSGTARSAGTTEGSRGKVAQMLTRADPLRELDQPNQELSRGNDTLTYPAAMPMDAWREGDTFVVQFDLPGVDAGAIDLDVERNVVTVKAERPAREDTGDMLAAERARGTFSRQLVLGDNLDTEAIEAGYDAGVLTLRIPVA